MRHRNDDVELICIESVHSMPQQGVTSQFSFGNNTGRAEGALQTLGRPIVKPSPQAWKKAVLVAAGYDLGVDLEKDERRKYQKQQSIKWATNTYPTVSLIPKGCRVPHDGIAEALDLAHYAYLYYLNPPKPKKKK
jgi:crossover junction endodeoxyribonuclease RuvC